MDQQRFDAALRALEAGTTRRAGLMGMLGVLLGGLAFDAAARGRGHGAGKNRKGPAVEGPCGDGSAKANRCTKNGDCCTKYCAQGECRCKPNWMACSKSEHCCSGKCLGGVCDGGCKPEGSRCEETFNCCSGMICETGTCTNSNKAKCSRANCPGCCDGTTCRVGLDRAACGSSGGACSRCVGAQPCQAGACSSPPPPPPPPPTCGPSTCAGGCCAGTSCVAGTDLSACGTGGAACATCSQSETCSGGACTPIPCDATTCSTGCCSDAVTCVAGTDAVACGTGGAACVTCTSLAPMCSSATCSAGTSAYNAQFGSSGTGDLNFKVPTGIWVSADTLTAWVGDTQNNRVSIWTRPDAASTTWSYSAQFGTQGSGNEYLWNPKGIWVSPDTLTAWVADYTNNRIVIWTRPNATSTTWSYSAQFGSVGSSDACFTNPAGIWVSADMLTAWVSDTQNNRISIWTRPDAASTTWSYSAQFGTQGSGNDNFKTPISVWVSADTLTAWVSDGGNNRISIWTRSNAASTTWSYSTQFGTQGSGDNNFNLPGGVWVSADTLTVWVTDRSNNRVSIWTRPDAASTTWSYSAQFGTQGSGNDNFKTPFVAWVSADTLTTWVADTLNNRIVIWRQS